VDSQYANNTCHSLLKKEAAVFAKMESKHVEPVLSGVTGGKAAGTYLEHKFQEKPQQRYAYLRGSSAKGIDFIIPGIYGGKMLVGRGFWRDAENNTPEAGAPRKQPRLRVQAASRRVNPASRRVWQRDGCATRNVSGCAQTPAAIRKQENGERQNLTPFLCCFRKSTINVWHVDESSVTPNHQ
jgi:hypothetical protein